MASLMVPGLGAPLILVDPGLEEVTIPPRSALFSGTADTKVGDLLGLSAGALDLEALS